MREGPTDKGPKSHASRTTGSQLQEWAVTTSCLASWRPGGLRDTVPVEVGDDYLWESNHASAQGHSDRAKRLDLAQDTGHQIAPCEPAHRCVHAGAGCHNGIKGECGKTLPMPR